MTARPLFDQPLAAGPKPKRPGSQTPVIPALAKLPCEKWVIEFSGRDDEVPAICRVRRMLKSADRAYRLKARIVAQPPLVAMSDNSTGNQSSASPRGPHSAANEVLERNKP